MPVNKEYDKTIHYYSDHITRRLQEMLHASTTVLEAPLGYGKTTAVRDYLEHNLTEDVPVYWFTAFDEDPQSSWRRLCCRIGFIDPQAGEALAKLGFPTIFTVGEIAETIRKIICPNLTVLVIDNLQLLQRHLPDDVLLALLYHGGRELHLILITQILAKNALAAFCGTGLYTIDEQDLRLSSADIQSYYLRSGVTISEQQAQEIEQYTEGWIIAVYLQLLSYMETGAFTAPAGIKALMQKLVWEQLDAQEQQFLLRISPCENVTRQQICFLLGVTSLPAYVEQLPNKVMMIRFMADKGCFHIHHILSELLRERLEEAGDAFKRECILDAANWYRRIGQLGEALSCLWSIRDYGGILELNLVGLDIAKACKTTLGSFALELSQKTPPESKAKHIVPMLRLAVILYGDGLRDDYAQLMKELKAIIEAVEQPEQRKHLLGEWALVSSYDDFPYIERMAIKYQEAAQLLSGPSQAVLPTDPYMFDCPSLKYLFHSELGDADKTADVLDSALATYTAITGGHGSGAGDLYRGELCYLRGQLKDAEELAYKAVYDAEGKRQTSIRFGAALLLGRIAITRSNSEELNRVIDYLNHTAAEATTRSIGSIRYCVDVVQSILLCQLEEHQGGAEWIVNGDLSVGMMEPGRLLLLYVYAFSLSDRKEYTRALSVLSYGLRECDRFHFLSIKLHLYLCQTLIYLSQDEPDLAAESFIHCLEQSIPDDILVVYHRFSERLERIQHHPKLLPYHGALEKIKKCNARLLPQKHPLLQDLIPLQQPQQDVLTEREYEVAMLAAKGNRNKEIAKLLNVSENTIKTHLKSAFSKLSIDRRSKLIKLLT